MMWKHHTSKLIRISLAFFARGSTASHLSTYVVPVYILPLKADFVNVNLPFALPVILIKLAARKKFKFLVKIA